MLRFILLATLVGLAWSAPAPAPRPLTLVSEFENSGVNRQTHTAGRANRANRYTSYRTGFPSRLCRTRSFTGIAIRLLFCTDRGDPVELLDRATWVPYYLLTAKIIRPVAVDLSKARVEVCVAARSLSPHR